MFRAVRVRRYTNDMRKTAMAHGNIMHKTTRASACTAGQLDRRLDFHA
jgi:hypothetical protein